MAAEDQAQELLMRAGEAGVRIVVDVARLGVGRLFDVLGIGVRAAGESLRHLRDTGRVSVRRLQRMGQPVTVQEVTGPHAASVARALKRAGVTFHIERSRKDGRVFLHFQGKDIQSVEHIVARLVDRLNHAAAQREPVAASRPSSQRLRGRCRRRSRSPARRLPRRSRRARNPTAVSISRLCPGTARGRSSP